MAKLLELPLAEHLQSLGFLSAALLNWLRASDAAKPSLVRYKDLLAAFEFLTLSGGEPRNFGESMKKVRDAGLKGVDGRYDPKEIAAVAAKLPIRLTFCPKGTSQQARTGFGVGPDKTLQGRGPMALPWHSSDKT